MSALGPPFVDPKASVWGPAAGACVRVHECHMNPGRHAHAPSARLQTGALRSAGPKGWKHGIPLL